MPNDRIEGVFKPWIERLAMYEPGKPLEETARALGLDSVDEIVKAASNENALGPSPLAVEAMRQAAADMHRYPDGGNYYLRHELAERHDLSPDAFVIGAGSNELIVFLSHLALEPGDRVVAADRAFVVYRLAAALFRAETVSVPMQAYTHDLDAMADAVDERTRLVYIANPNNPTGTRLPPERIEAFLARLPDHVLPVLDEAYDELLPGNDRSPSMQWVREGRRLVVLRTFSKGYGLAGLRIGYAAAPPELARWMHLVRQPFNVNAMAQAAARAALRDEDHLRNTQAMTAEGLAYYHAQLSGAGMDYLPSCVNFLCIRVGKGREVFRALEQRKVIARPLDIYNLPEYIRVTVGTAEENRRVWDALTAVLGKQDS